MALLEANNTVGWLQANTWNTAVFTQTAGKLKSFWYNPDACTATYQAVCEVPITVYTCPPAPPSSPPPAVHSTGLCEYILPACIRL
jgi:hypothetical protein